MPKENSQMKQELNYQTIDLCYELGEDKEDRTKKYIRQTDKTLEITMEMGMVETTQTENQNITVITYHSNETVSMRKIKIKIRTNTLGMKIDNSTECE